MPVDFDPSQMETWDVQPRGMMQYYQSQPYSLGQSIADLIDNCFDAGAKTIDVKIDFDNDKPFIRVLDDGRGMTETKLKKAMQLGTDRHRADTDLAVFGIGMKLSSLAQADQVTVVSVSGGKMAIRRIDAPYIRKTNKNRIQKFQLPESEVYDRSRTEMIKGKWSTMILLEDIHGKSWVTYDVDKTTALVKEIKKIKVHLQLTYQRILENEPDVSLRLQDKEITPLDPSMSWETGKKYGTVLLDDRITVKIQKKTVIVPIKFVIVPHSKQRQKNKTKCELMHKGYKKANDMQGLYLYRNDRLIQYGDWQGLLGDTKDEHNKLGKIMVEIPPAHYEWFGLNPTKTEVNLPHEFLRKLASKMAEERRWGWIKNGKKTSYGDAIDHRYRKEGITAINRDKKAKEKKQREGAKGAGSTVPLPPGSSRKKSTKQPKPKPVVDSIDETNPKLTVVKLDKSKDGYEKLLQYLRMWKE